MAPLVSSLFVENAVRSQAAWVSATAGAGFARPGWLVKGIQVTAEKVFVETGIGADPNEVELEEIYIPPIPPPERPQAREPAPRPAASSSRDREELAFRAPAKQLVTLQFPFDHPELGAVEEIRVRRLTVGEVGEILDTRTGSEPDNFDIYARMTGLPARVLRGLADMDGEEVVNACWDFLPRMFRASATASSSTSTTGDP